MFCLFMAISHVYMSLSSIIKNFVHFRSFEEAAKWALETKDYDGLEYVINKSGPSIKSKLIAMRQQALSRR